MASATAQVQVDNDRVRVTRWSFAPGDDTGFHQHGLAYVVVPVVSGVLEIRAGRTGESSRHQLVAGEAYFREAGAHHNAVNAGADDLVFLEVEIKI